MFAFVFSGSEFVRHIFECPYGVFHIFHRMYGRRNQSEQKLSLGNDRIDDDGAKEVVVLPKVESHIGPLVYGARKINGGDGGFGYAERSEERRVGKECRSRWSPYH